MNAEQARQAIEKLDAMVAQNPEAEQPIRVITIRVTSTERLAVVRKANAVGMSLNQFLRTRAGLSNTAPKGSQRGRKASS